LIPALLVTPPNQVRHANGQGGRSRVRVYDGADQLP
jgi:hypothetical protein